MSARPQPASPKLSRGEIETLCILHVVGRAGCPVADLAPRLGMSAALSDAVAQAMEALVLSGLLAESDGRFTVTAAGQAHLAGRLEAVGLEPG